MQNDIIFSNETKYALNQLGAASTDKDFLFLIESKSVNDHQALYYEHIINNIVGHRSKSTYFFYATPLVCHNTVEAGTVTVSIETIKEKHPSSILVIVSNGMQFINSRNGKLLKWVSVFDHWEDKFFLSNKHHSIWGRCEKILNGYFSCLLPFNHRGLLWLGEMLLGVGQKITTYHWTKSSDYKFLPINKKYSFSMLNLFFSPMIKHWIGLCLKQDSLNWDKTITLGESIFGGFVLEDNFKHLLRLDYFKSGIIEPKLKSKIINSWGEPPTVSKTQIE